MAPEFRENKSFGWLTFIRRVIKCYQASWPEDDVNHLRPLYMERYAERKPGLDKGQDCWPCMTLHLPLFSMYNLRYKSSSWKKSCRPGSPKLGLLVSFFPSLSLFVFRLIWSAEAEFIFLLGLLRPSREGALCLHPIERAPVAYVNSASPVLRLYWLSV